MIGFTKIGRLFPSLLMPMWHPFSNQKARSTLSLDAQRAILATAVMKKIRFAKGSDDITKPSLREQIISLKHPADWISDLDEQNRLKTKYGDKIIIDDQIINQILDIFQNGAPLPDSIFSQDRVKQAKDLIENKQANIVFCPNVLVTKEVFDKLFKLKQSQYFIYGAFGISKTFALVIFYYLSSIINKFVYRAHTNKLLKIELELLQKDFLDKNVPKLFYWSLNQQDNLDDLKNIILLQATELSEEQIKKLKNSTSIQMLVKDVRNMYSSKGIRTYSLMDQINVMASKFRQWNYFYYVYQIKQRQYKQNQQKINENIKKLQTNESLSLKQIQEKIKKEESLKLQSQKEFHEWEIFLQQNLSIRNKTQELRKRMKMFEKIGEIRIYNSSINIQQDLIKPQPLNTKQRTMDLQNGHVPIPLLQIPYFRNLSKTWGCNELSHYFWFQLEKKLQLSSQFTHQSSLKQLKQIFYDEAKGQKWPNFIRLLNIAHIIREDPKDWFGDRINDYFSKDNFTEIAKRLIQELPEYSIKNYQQKLRRYLVKAGKKESRNRLMFMHLIYGLAQAYDQSSNNNLSIEIPELPEGIIKSQLQKHLNNSYANKQLFAFEFSSLIPTITFFWTPKQFVDVVKDVLYDSTISAWNMTSEITENVLVKSKAALGLYLEAALIRALKCKDIIFSFTIQINKKTERLQFNTKQTSTFEQLNQKIGQLVTIKSNFGNIFKVAENNQNCFIFGQPIKIKNDLQTESPISKAVDYVYVRYDSSNKKTPFTIFSFDLSVTTIPQSVSKRRGTSRDTYSSLIQRSEKSKQINYTIQHIIIGGVKQNKYEKSEHLNIGTTLIQTVQLIPLSSDLETKSTIEDFNFLKSVYEMQKARKTQLQKKRKAQEQSRCHISKKVGKEAKQTEATEAVKQKQIN